MRNRCAAPVPRPAAAASSTAALPCRRLPLAACPPCGLFCASPCRPAPPAAQACSGSGRSSPLPAWSAGWPSRRASASSDQRCATSRTGARPPGLAHVTTSAFTVPFVPLLLRHATPNNTCDDNCSCMLQEGEASEPGYTHLSCAKASLPSGPPAAPQAAVSAILCMATTRGCGTWKADLGLPGHCCCKTQLQHTHPNLPTLPLAGVQALALPRLLPVWRALRVPPPSRVLGGAGAAAASAGVRRRGRLHVDQGHVESRPGLVLPCLPGSGLAPPQH